MAQRVGKYEIIEVLGRGGMGVVYKAVDPAIGRTVALKVLLPGDSQSGEMRERFLREARAAGGLQHPNIVVIHDLGEDAGNLYIAMEYLEGRTLADLIGSSGARSDAWAALDVMAQVARGLHYAHQRNIVHRDIKPGNILVTADGVAKILDFGIARAGDQRMTKTGEVMGTIFYMSPEQINGQQLDGRSDIFSAGIVLYELLTGEVPFEAESTGATMMRILTAPTPSLSTRAPLSPPALDAIVGRALGKKPEDRYATAAEFANALTDAMKLCEVSPPLGETKPPPATIRATSPAAEMQATVLHRQQAFTVTTNPVFLNDLAEAKAAANGGTGAAAAARSAVEPLVSSGAATETATDPPASAATRVKESLAPSAAAEPWSWWRLFWPAKDVRHTVITARFAAGVSICVALGWAALAVAHVLEYSPAADPQHTAEELFIAGTAAFTYAFLAKQVLRFSRTAALLSPPFFVALCWWVLEEAPDLTFLREHLEQPGFGSWSLLFLLLLSQVAGIRAAFAHHGAPRRTPSQPWRRRLWRMAVSFGVYFCILGALAYVVYGEILPSQEARAMRALLREQREIKPFLRETLGGSPETVPGYYVGTLFGSGLKFAKIEMVVNLAADGKLVGCFAIHRPLFGSGALTGSHLGPLYWLWVESGDTVMTLNGDRAGADLTGTYTVKNKITEHVEPKGTFNLYRDSVRSVDSTFAPLTCPDDSVIE
jgi:serine/threonine protein kinase